MCARAAWIAERGRAAGQRISEEVCIVDDERFLTVWHSSILADCFDGTNGLTGATVDALIRINVELPIAFINAIDGAGFHTGLVSDVNARSSDDIRQGSSLARKWRNIR